MWKRRPVRNWLVLSAASAGALALATAAQAQTSCTTNYCISAQVRTLELPPGWPAVPIAPCCKTDWGARPGGIDWSKGAPVMICVGAAEYATSFPNCGDSASRSQAFPLSYERPTIGIGVAWPSAKDYRYELQSVPILDGADGTCAQYSHQPVKLSQWWVHEIKEPKTGIYVFSAALSFQQGENGFVAVLSGCSLSPPVAAR
jgi:hypothetical protein